MRKKENLKGMDSPKNSSNRLFKYGKQILLSMEDGIENTYFDEDMAYFIDKTNYGNNILY